MNYLRLIAPDFHDHLPEDGQGVYTLVSLDSDGKVTPIPRFLGVDTEGILYIGCSPQRTLRERLADLIKATHPKYRGGSHIFGRKYKRIASVVAVRFPFESLAIRFELSSEPGKLEKHRIQEYRKIYGEEPPFNSH